MIGLSLTEMAFHYRTPTSNRVAMHTALDSVTSKGKELGRFYIKPTQRDSESFSYLDRFNFSFNSIPTDVDDLCAINCFFRKTA
jgi:hypothetical protein